MTGNDWQRDQWEREQGSRGIVTGSAENRRALDDRAAQERLTKTIEEGLARQASARNSAPGYRVPPPTPFVQGGEIGKTPPLPISSTALILAITAVSGLVTFLATGDLFHTVIVGGVVSAGLFGLRATYRSGVLDRVLTAVIGMLLFGYVTLLGTLAIGAFGAVVYLVWKKAGPEPALWLIGAVASFIAFLVAVDWLRNRYHRFKSTPGGKRFTRTAARVRMAILFCMCAAGLWWVAVEFQLL